MPFCKGNLKIWEQKGSILFVFDTYSLHYKRFSCDAFSRIQAAGKKGIPKEWPDAGNTGDTHSTREGIREGKERGKGVFCRAFLTVYLRKHIFTPLLPLRMAEEYKLLLNFALI